MNDLKAAAQQALEALETNRYAVANQAPHLDVMEYNAAITALRAALAQQAEPVQAPAYKVKVTGRWHDAQPLPPAFNLPDGEHLLYTAPSQRKPLTEKEMYIVEEEARKNFRLAQAGPRGQMITYWDSLTPWLIRAVERAHGIKERR